MAKCIGCGLTSGVDGLLKVQVRPGGGLDCDNSGDANDGLYVVPGAVTAAPGTTTVVTGDTATIDGFGTGLAGDPIKGNVRKSSSACNGLRLDPDGVYAACPSSYTCLQNTGFFGGAIIGVGNGLNTGCGAPPCNFDLLSQCNINGCSTCPGGLDAAIHFCLPANICCQTQGFWDVQAYGGAVAGNPGFNAVAELMVIQNGVGPVISTPPTFFRMQNLTASVQTYDINNMWERNFIVMDPGNSSRCFDVQALIRIAVFAGSGTWTVGPNFEFHFGPITQTGCC